MLKKAFAALCSASLLTDYLGESKAKCCGIVAVAVSQKPVEHSKSVSPEKFLSNGLELVKNRGYDSAGIAIISRKQGIAEAHLVKHAYDPKMGCIERVTGEVLKNISGTMSGIGHTRWATCGQKTSRNAHPHSDEKQEIFLVHNGIISNHSQIKSKLLGNVKFTSETDSEVIVQLLGKYKKEGKSISEGLQLFGKETVAGSQWGLVVIDKANPEVIYTSTNGSPLLIGFSKDEDRIYVASELIVFQTHANCYFESKDHEVWELRTENIPAIKKTLGNAGRLKDLELNVEVLRTPPAPYLSFYSYEVRQQGTIPFKPDFERVKNVFFGDYLSIIACGSSFYASRSIESFFYKLNCFKKIQILKPEDLHPNSIVDHETVVLVSQSGQTRDLMNILEECRKKQLVSTIGVINVEGSQLARKVDFPIYIKVGREISVAATKSFFHQVLNIVQFALEVSSKNKSADPELIKQIKAELLITPDLAKQTIAICEQSCAQLAKLLMLKQSIYLLANGEALPIAQEAALKIKELNYIHAEALGANDMKHGPIALIESDKPLSTVVFLFILDNKYYNEMMNTLDQMHSRQAFVVVITNCLDKINLRFNKTTENNSIVKYHFVLNVPHLKHMSHLLSIIPIQILVEQIALLKGIEVDEPRNLAKTVTV